MAVALIVILIWYGVVPSYNLSWIVVTLIHLSLLPLLYGAYVYKTKRISDSEIMARQERILPFFVITFMYGLYVAETLLFNAPDIFKTLAFHFFVLALVLSTITLFWKVSVHTAGATQFVLLLVLLIGNNALVLAPLVAFTGWLRIKMRSHDIRQVLGGIVVAAASAVVAISLSRI